MSSVRVLLATLVVATGLVLATALPAASCSCVGAGLTRQLSWADEVFLGSVVSVDQSDDGDRYAYEVDVSAEFKGDPAAVTTLTSGRGGGDCGYGPDIKAGRPYVFYASQADDGDLSIGICDGTRPATPPVVAAVAHATGVSPVPDVPDRVPVAKPLVPAWVWPAGSAVVVVALGLWAVRRRILR